MGIDRATLNVIILSLGYAVISTIQPRFYPLAWDCAKSRIIFDIAFVICSLIAPSYVSLSGTRISILTSYTCHVFYISSFIWPHPNLIYTASAVLGFGAALISVAQGLCLTENHNPRTIHRHAWIFWLLYQIFLLIRDQLLKRFLPEVTDEENGTVSLFAFKIFVVIIIIICNSIILLLREPQKEYSLGGMECIPNGKIITNGEPREGPLSIAWKPFENLLKLFVSSKMLFLSFLLIYTGVMQALMYNRFVDESMNDVTDIFIRLGEIWGAMFSTFCYCKKIGDSSMIVFMGLLMFTVSFSMTSMNPLQNKESYWGNLAELSEEQQNHFKWMARVERFSFGFGDACFHTQIYSLVGALFSKNCASAFALVGLYYWAGYSFGMNYIADWESPPQLRLFLVTGMIAVVSVSLIEILYVNRSFDIDIIKKSPKTREIAMKIAKEVPLEIRMLYAGSNDIDKKKESEISIGIPEAGVLGKGSNITEKC